MVKKQIIGILIFITALGFIFVKPANSALETQLLVDVSPSTDYVPYTQTQWYGFSAIGGKGYCVILSPSTGNSNLYLFDTNFNWVGYSKNTGTTQDKVWYGQSTTGPFHLACYGVANPSTNYTIQVIAAPYVKIISPTSGSAGTLVTLYGFGFGDTQGSSFVKFGVVNATSYYSWANTQIKVYVPAGISAGAIQVVVYVASRPSNPINFTSTNISSEGTMFRYDLARTGNYPNGPTSLPLNVKWSYYLGGGATNYTPIIANNIVYVDSWDKLYALDANTGALKWSYYFGGGFSNSYSSPAVAGGIVYVGRFSTLYALDATTGSLKWKYDAGGSYITSPAVLNGIAYFATASSKMFALDAMNGSLKWTYLASGLIQYPPAIANGVIYFGDNNRKIYALYANNGAVKWIYTLPTSFSITGTPAVFNGVVYFGAYLYLYAVDANTGTLKWSQAGYYLTPAISNGVIYIPTHSYPGIRALDANTGVTKWYLGDIRGGFSTAAVSNGLVFTLRGDGKIDALDANTGNPKWSYAIGASFDGVLSPVIYNGKVYVVGEDRSKLYCFGQ